MKRTPSSARRIARSVLIAVWPTYWPTSEARSTSTRWPFSSSPIAPYISASSRATVVLPVPGLPRKTRCWLVATSGRSCSFRRACTCRNASRACTCSLTVSRPTRPSSSACSSGSGRGGVARGPRPSRSSSSGPAVRLQLVAELACGAAEVLDRIRRHESLPTRIQRSSSARWSAATCCSSRATRSSSGLCVPVHASRRSVELGWLRLVGASPRSCRQRSWLCPGRRGSFSVSSAAASASSACSTSSIERVRVEPLDPLLQLAGCLRRRGASARRAGRSARERGRGRRRAGGGTWRPGYPARSRVAPSRAARGGRARHGSPPRRSRRPDPGSSPDCRRAGASSARAGTGRASSAASRRGSRGSGSRRRRRPRRER